MISAAKAADTVRVRGTVENVDGSKLTVKTREGYSTAIKLNDNWKVIGVVKAAIDDIKPGDFVGIASIPKSGGGDGAIEVLIFPAAMKGTGEGSYPWDLKPNSTMTNATVSNAVKDVGAPSFEEPFEPPFDADVVVNILLAAGNGSRAHRGVPPHWFPATISNRRASPSVCNSAVAPTTLRLGRSVPMPGSIARAPHGSCFAIKSSGTSPNFRRGRTI
jgi:hypothetical protein